MVKVISLGSTNWEWVKRGTVVFLLSLLIPRVFKL